MEKVTDYCRRLCNFLIRWINCKGGKTMVYKLISLVCVFIMYAPAASAATYYVSPAGNDRNPGTSQDRPFRVAQHAVDRMQAGDTLVVLDGVYTGTLKLKSGITIKAKNPRKAIFSGVEPLEANFERHAGNIYKARISGSSRQLFYNDQPMTWARWPNARWSENWIADKKWAKAADGTGPGVLISDAFKQIEDMDLSGGYCFIRYGKRNSCYSRLIESFDGTTLHWNDENFYTKKYTGSDGPKGTAEEILKMRSEEEILEMRKKDENYEMRLKDENHPNKTEFFLAGSLVLLDAPGEWFAEDGILYLYPSDGKPPSESVILCKTADYCINEKEPVSDINIEGIDFFACSVRLGASGNSNIRFENAHFRYINNDLLHIDRVQGEKENKPVQIAGAKIRIEKCLFAGAMQSALSLTGEDLHVENCVFIENNRHATFECRPLLVYVDGDYQITRNTFFNNPSDAIRILPDLSKMQSLNPEVSYNHIFNAGRYNTDVSGIYFPSKSQRYAEVHHNWFHNVNGNAVRLDLAGKELNVHHNVFWSTYRALSIEGYGYFNVYNNTAVHNRTPADLIRNVLHHSQTTEGSMDKSFPPIDDWNVLNNLVEQFNDRVGPREKITHNEAKEQGLLHPERDKSWLIPVVDRGSIQGNITGERRGVFTNGELSGLNLIPTDPIVKNGVSQTKELAAQGVTALGSYRGAYDIGDEYWYPGSDWMPYGLPVLKTMAEAERFAKKYRSISIVPEIRVRDLPSGSLSLK